MNAARCHQRRFRLACTSGACRVMKKIVLVSGNRIAPAATGGQVRSISIARALARIGHSVHIFSTAGRREDYRGANIRRRMTLESSIETRRRIHAPGPDIWNNAGACSTPRLSPCLAAPNARAGHRSEAPQQALREADIVLSDLPYCPPIPGPWRKKPWYLISHNLEHRLLEQGGPRQRRFASWMRGIEGAAPQTYTDIFACAEEDRAFFQVH